MPSLPTLTEADILSWVGETSLARGRPYVQDGSILNPRRQGSALKAQCLGSAPTPYRVEAVLTDKAIASSHCSCPVGSYGRCKHVAALLLSWLKDPALFTVVEALTAALNQRTKDELVILMTKMLDRYPDLEALLALPVVDGGKAPPPVDPKVIERQVNQAFRYIDHDNYGSLYDIVQKLTEIKTLGDQYLAAADWRNAVTVYQTVMEGVLDNYEMMGDENGECSDIVNECVTGLGQCLAAVQDAPLRQVILHALFSVELWDVKWGGIDMGYEAPDLIVEQATPAERAQVAAWVRAELPKGEDWSSSWQREALGGFLLRLEADTLDDEMFLRICRETGRHRDFVERLLHLGRIDEAVAATAAASDYELLAMEALFVEHALVDCFAQLIVARAQNSDDRRLKEWLKARALAEDDPALALQLTEELFWTMPSLEKYQEVAELAQRLQQWPTLRQEIHQRLQADQRYQTLLTQIYLEEDDIDAALRMVQQPAKTGLFLSGPQSMKLEVARAAETTRPHAAIHLYREQIQRSIDQRNRDSYATAAQYLVHLRPLYERINDLPAWQQLVTEIRTNNSRLRALQDELRKAGL
ncbi:MAG: hypothetical protein R3E79_17375 [Caldilineaceae bacterium]